MIKHGEIYQIGNYKYLIISDKAEQYIGCLISSSDKRKMLSDMNYYIHNYGYVCCEYIRALNTEDLKNNIGKIDDIILSEIKSLITKITMGVEPCKSIQYLGQIEELPIMEYSMSTI